MPMKAELKKKWVEALRSRKFKQTQEVLKREISDNKFGYCCLGVLHEIDDGKWHTSGYNHTRIQTGKKETSSSDEAYLRGKFARGLSDNEMEELVKLNDTKCYKFYQIANWIEKNIKTKN